MKKSRYLVAMLMSICFMVPHAMGETGSSASLEVAGYAREMPPGAPMGAAYLRLRNLASGERVLEQIQLPAHPAAKVELHTTLQVDGVSKMRALKNLPLPANGTLEMRPGATHLMVHGVRLSAGETLALKLIFADGSSHDLALPVLGLNDKLPEGMRVEKVENHHHHHHEHG